MIPTLLSAAVAAILRSLAVHRLERWNISAPVVMVAAGALVGLTVESSVGAALNTEVSQRAAELILAVLLFVDATEVRGGRLWGNSPGLAARLLVVAMPLSLAASVLVGMWLFPELPTAALLVLACVVVPIDFAPSERVVRDRRLALRVRNALNVEGGYNDGIVSPIFLFALVLAGGDQHTVSSPAEALTTALPFAIKAVVVGLALGTLLSWLLDRSSAHGWATDQSRRIVVLLTPVLAYAVAVAINGNGFVAAFVSGIAFRYVHRLLVARRLHRSPEAARSAPIALTKDFTLLEDVTALLTMAMWFVVGIAGIFLITAVDLKVALFCGLVLTVVRVVPVYLSTVGSKLDGRDRLLLGLLGPRGTTTIVFGLLAFNALPDGSAADTILITTVLCVVGSVLLHGIGSSPVIGGLTAARGRGAPEEADLTKHN